MNAFLGAAFLATATLCAAQAQDYPIRPVRIIVPFGAGSTPDIFVRTVSERVAASLTQALVIENRVGAGGNVGTDIVAKAVPDGYTFLITAEGDRKSVV